LNTTDQDGLGMNTNWPTGYEKQGTLTISTIGRRTGRKHDTTIWFAVDIDGKLLIATQDKRRDWVRNAMKNPSVEVTIGDVTRKMKVIPLGTDSDKQHVNDLYAKKYLAARFGRLFMPFRDFSRFGVFELQLR
jgi:deazaflavin-dependent oxidoreductase (nitroreductase family)